MIGYRFISLAEEEMIEAALFYDAAASGLGTDFLNVSSTQLIEHVNIPTLAN